jgi:phospholipid transport system transporter-binding protein
LSKLNVEVTESAPGRVSVRGALTFETARRACELGVKHFKRAKKAPSIEVDCGGVTEADSAGLAVLLEWLKWALKHERPMSFENLPPAIRAVARISDVEPLLDGGIAVREAA